MPDGQAVADDSVQLYCMAKNSSDIMMMYCMAENGTNDTMVWLKIAQLYERHQHYLCSQNLT